MKYKGIQKVHAGRFLTRYDVSYETEEGTEKVYEMISRKRDLATLADLNNPRAEAVVLMLTDETGEKLLLNEEYRLSVGGWVFNFPAGLVEPGETPEEAAARELREETGLTLLRIDDILHESYSAVGFSNEKNIAVYGCAGGEFAPSTSADEEIHAGWYTREEVRELLRTRDFAGRTQSFCYLWSGAAAEARK